MKRAYLYFILFLFSYSGISQSVDFTYNTGNGLFCTPSTVSFTQACTGNPTGFVWDFGNNVQSNAANPVITFSSAGVYNVKLTAIYEQTALETVKLITVNPAVTVSIYYDRNYICKPGVINFTAAGTGNIQAYEWNFGDGSAIVTTTGPAASHSFPAFGSFLVSLKATSNAGCTAIASTSILVIQPPIFATVSPTRGCVPAISNFSAVVTVPTGSSVTGYQWDFGDGSPVANTISNTTSHTYSDVNPSTPVLNITTSEGCTGTFNFAPVVFGTPPINHVSYLQDDTICASQTLSLFSKASNANYYYWEFGDGSNTYVADTVAYHKYSSLGNKIASVTPYFNGCPGTTINSRVFITGVIAAFTYANVCADKNNFSFYHNSIGNVDNIRWDFGDGALLSNVFNPVNRYINSGTYQTTMSVSDNISGCTDKYTVPIYISSPSLVNNDSSLCKGAFTTFTVQNTTPNPKALYMWHVAGGQFGPNTNPALTTKTAVLGNLDNYVIIDNGPGYCPDTIRQNKKLIVRGPLLDFSMPSQVCLSGSLQPDNASQPFLTTDSIKLWYWNFGDNGFNDSIYQPSAHKYAAAGNYNVVLWAIDKNGCRDSLAKPVAIRPIPFIRTIPSNDTLCLGQNKTLIAFHSDSLKWTPGVLVNCPDCDSVIVSPPATTRFFATATNQYGCSNYDSLLIKVFAPFNADMPFMDSSICMNDSLQLYVLPTNKKVVWSPPAGLSATNIYSPMAFPKQSTGYSAILTDSAGCFSDSVAVSITVNTLPTVDAGADRAYPFHSTFNFSPAYSANARSYKWLPPALLSCPNCAALSGIADYTETYTVKVVSDSGCKASDSITIFVECKDAYMLMPGAFSPDNNYLNDIYYPLTRGIKTVKSFLIYNRLGQLIFQAKNFPPNNKTFGWNGKFNGVDQPVGAYVYVLDVICDLGQAMSKKGSFLLMR